MSLSLPLEFVTSSAIPVPPITTILAGFETWTREWLDAASGPWQYVLVFLLAATPLLEILVVIPIGIALGLDPLAVAVVAFAGNVLPIYGIVVLSERVSAWLERRRSNEPSARRKRATRIWNAYGLPGLALVSPIVTGVHLATVLALSLGARRRTTLVWMTASIALWTALITIGSLTGLAVLESLV